ncbi:MAG: hypothetical protein ABIN15_03375 [candidate division WOR-3 bacterium]
MSLVLFIFFSSISKPLFPDKKVINIQKKFEIIEKKFSKFYPYLYLKENYFPFKRKEIKIQKTKNETDTVKFNILAIRVAFQKEEPDDPLTTGNGWFDLSSKGNPDSIPFFSEPPHDKKYFETYLESLKAFLASVGYGRIKIKKYVVKPDKNDSFYVLPYPMRYYGDSEHFEEGLVKLLVDALHLSDQDETINFMDIDNNGIKDYKEGIRDIYIIFHAGSTWQTDFGDTPYDIATVTIPQGALEYYTGEKYVILNGGIDTVVSGILLPEQPSQDGIEVELQGLLFHEFPHDAFYATDLYGVNGLSSGVGSWCLMGTGGWNEVGAENLNGDIESVFGAIPSFPSAWMKLWFDYAIQVVPERFFVPDEWYREPIKPLWGFSIYKGMVDTFIPYLEERDFSIYEATEPSQDTINYLPDSVRFPKVIFIPIDEYEYFLLEYRNDLLFGNNELKGFFKKGALISPYGAWDFLLPGSGLLVWHIDERVIIEHYWEVNSYPPYKGVDLVEADGIQDFDKWTDSPETFYGSEYDAFFKGFKDNFSYKTFPSSKARSGGNTFIEIKDISERRKHKINFKLKNNFLKLHIKDYLPPDILPLNAFFSKKKNFIVSLIGGFKNYYGDTVYFTNGINNFYSAFFVFDTSVSLLNTIYLKPIISSPFAISDINRDSILEIFYLKNGKLSLLKLNNTFDTVSFNTLPMFSSIPSLYDINNDGEEEIILTGEDYFLYLLSGKKPDSVINKTYAGSKSKSGIIISRNPSLIYFMGTDGVLRVFDYNFNKLKEVFNPYYGFSEFPSICADYDNDGFDEIMGIRGKNNVYFFDYIEDKFYERKIDDIIVSPPAVFDVDKDGLPDFVFKTENKFYSFNYLLALNNNFPLDISSFNGLKRYLSPISSDKNLIFSIGNRLTSLTFLEEFNINLSSFGVEDIFFDEDGDLFIFLGTGEIKVFAYSEIPFYFTYGGNFERNFYFGKKFEKLFSEKKISLIVYPSVIKNKKGFIRIFTKEKGNLSLNFYTFSGHLVGEKNIYISDINVEKDISFDFSFLTPGPYILKWKINKEEGLFKFFVEK